MLSNFMPAAHMVRLARQQQHMLSVQDLSVFAHGKVLQSLLFLSL